MSGVSATIQLRRRPGREVQHVVTYRRSDEKPYRTRWFDTRDEAEAFRKTLTNVPARGTPEALAMRGALGRRRTYADDRARITQNIKRERGCWIWQRFTNRDGYGKMMLVSPQGGRRAMLAHRAAYEILVGPIPEGLTLDHLCGRRACVNPDHLEPVTLEENIRRANIVVTPPQREF